MRLVDNPDKPAEPVRLPNAQVAVRRVVEMRIPYKDIEAALEKAGGGPISAKGDSPVLAETKTGTVPAPVFSVSGPKARPWVRVFCTAWDRQKKRIVDEGPTAASFRLVATPYPLDAALPERPRPPLPIGVPVQGQWFLWQGPFGSYSHRGDWAYDLVILDATGQQLLRRREEEHRLPCVGQAGLRADRGARAAARSRPSKIPTRGPSVGRSTRSTKSTLRAKGLA